LIASAVDEDQDPEVNGVAHLGGDGSILVHPQSICRWPLTIFNTTVFYFIFGLAWLICVIGLIILWIICVINVIIDAWKIRMAIS
jgi:hypothetical protein